MYADTPVTGLKKPALRKIFAKVDLDKERGECQSMHEFIDDRILSYIDINT